MKAKAITAFLAALMFAATVHARPPQEAALTPVNPALFVVRDADSAIYLFGTVHVRRPGADWGGANAHAALAESEEVWTELEMSAAGQADATRMLWRYGVAEPGAPLSSFLSEEERGHLAAAAARLNVSPQMFESMRPWFAAITLTLLPMLQAGYDGQSGVDRSIDEAADAAGKRRRAFETAEQQVRFLAEMSIDAQRQMLLEAIASAEAGESDLDLLSEAWARGDIEALERAVIDETRAHYPEVYDVMFVQRNNAWIAMLDEEMEGSGVDFVAVGAGHLLGEHGLVEQMRARGFSVERVSPAE